MKNNTKLVPIGFVIGISLVLQINTASAEDLKKLSAQWWQWANSIPIVDNPMLDNKDIKDKTGKILSKAGAKCSVGQQGNIWFLAGIFYPTIFNKGTTETAVTRTCSIPEGKMLFVPVFNSLAFNSPKVCGQDTNNKSAPTLRDNSANEINKIATTSVKLDGKSIGQVQRIKSNVFETTLPENNVYDRPCAVARFGNVPAGIYSPAVDDGYYTLLKPLAVGKHKLQFSAKTSSVVKQNVTYNLTVVPVLKK